MANRLLALVVASGLLLLAAVSPARSEARTYRAAGKTARKPTRRRCFDLTCENSRNIQAPEGAEAERSSGAAAKPSDRLTGINSLSSDWVPKRLEILKGIYPKLRRVVTFYDATNRSRKEGRYRLEGPQSNLALNLLNGKSARSIIM